MAVNQKEGREGERESHWLKGERARKLERHGDREGTRQKGRTTTSARTVFVKRERTGGGGEKRGGR